MLLRLLLKLLPLVWSIRVAIIQEDTIQLTKENNYKTSAVSDLVCSRSPASLKRTAKTYLQAHENLTVALGQYASSDWLDELIKGESLMNGTKGLEVHNLSTTTVSGFGRYATYFVFEEITLRQLIKKENSVPGLCGVIIILILASVLLRKTNCRRKTRREPYLNQDQIKVEKPDEVLRMLESTTAVRELKEQSRKTDLAEWRAVGGQFMYRPASPGKLLLLKKKLKIEKITNSCEAKPDLFSQRFEDTNMNVQENTLTNMDISNSLRKKEEMNDIVTVKMNRELTSNRFVRSTNTPTFVLLAMFPVLSNHPAASSFVYLADTIRNTNPCSSFIDIIKKKQTVERRNSLQLFANSRRDFFTFAGMISACNSSTRCITVAPHLPTKGKSLYTWRCFSLRHSLSGRNGVRILSLLFSGFTKKSSGTSGSERRNLYENELD